jgi:sulfide dehydrogenase cytochrome subunit
MRALPAILALLAMPAAAEPSAQMLADTCAMCHGTDGVSAGVLDSLRDMSAREIEEEMLDFKNAGKGRIMAPLARAYSDAQIRAIAEHLARPGGGQ